ncbi:MAG: putative quinol monooxygenase [Atribacterota bacterium]|nr:putative quinol monooxygenase [Atribacterota bacterium]
MIRIVSKSNIKEGKKEEFKNLAAELIKGSQQEPGCVSYDLYEDINNVNTVAFIEEWKDLAAIEGHRKSPHFTKIVPQLAELREGKPELNLYKPVF